MPEGSKEWFSIGVKGRRTCLSIADSSHSFHAGKWVRLCKKPSQLYIWAQETMPQCVLQIRGKVREKPFSCTEGANIGMDSTGLSIRKQAAGLTAALVMPVAPVVTERAGSAYPLCFLRRRQRRRLSGWLAA